MPPFSPNSFTVGVLNAVLSVSVLAGVLCPPRSACLPICLPSGSCLRSCLPICLPTGFVFHLGLGCCVRLARLVSGFVSQFVSHLALSFTLGWGAVSASLGLSPNLSPIWLLSPVLSPNLSPSWLCLSPWAGVLCPPRSACLPICLPSGSCLRSCLPICLPTGFVFHLGLGCCVRLARLVSQFVSQLALSFTLGWGAVSASLGLSPNLSPIWLLSPVLSPNLSPNWLCLSPWAGVLCPPCSACLRVCLRVCLPICLPSGFVFHLGLGCCVRFAGLVSQFVSQFVSHLALVSGLVSQFVSQLALSFTLGWGAVSASLSLTPNFSPIWLLSPVLSPNLSPNWLCLSPWAGVLCPPRSACLPICLPTGFVFHLGLGCCVRLARLVSQFVSHLALVFGLVSQFVSHLALSFTLGWGAVSASLGLSPNLSPNLSPSWLCLSPWAGVLCPPRPACLPICLPTGFVFHLGLGCCVRLARLVSQFVSHLALSFTLGWGAVSASLSLSPNLSPNWLCLSPWAGVLCPPCSACLRVCLPICLPSGFVFHLGLGCCVRFAGLVSQFVPQLVSGLVFSLF